MLVNATMGLGPDEGRELVAIIGPEFITIFENIAFKNLAKETKTSKRLLIKRIEAAWVGLVERRCFF